MSVRLGPCTLGTFLHVSVSGCWTAVLVYCRLRDHLRNRLTECGWRDQVRLMCRDVVIQDSGQVNVEKIVQQITPEARRMVPDTVKKEILQKIKNTLANQLCIDLWLNALVTEIWNYLDLFLWWICRLGDRLSTNFNEILWATWFMTCIFFWSEKCEK